MVSPSQNVQRIQNLLDRFPVAPTEDRPDIIDEINEIFKRIKDNQLLTREQINSIGERAFSSLDAIVDDEYEWLTINTILDWCEKRL